MTKLSRPVLVLVALSLGATRCGGPEEELSVVFPDALTREATSSLVVTAFEPLERTSRTTTRFLACGDVGVFVPTVQVSPALLGGPDFGRVFIDGEAIEVVEGFQKEIKVPSLEETSQNPWGAVMVLVEAQGEVLGPPDEGDGRRLATLAQGCFCVRTTSGSHPDPDLDADVKQACVSLDRDSQRRSEVALQPLPTPAFRLELCGTDQVNGPTGGATSPGPSACLRVTLCREDPSAPNCYECEGACPERDSLQNVPVRFEVEGGGVGPATLVTVTDREGRAEVSLDLSNCGGDYEISAAILGRRDEQVRFRGSCVEPVGSFACGGEIDLSGIAPVDLTTLPALDDANDLVAALVRSDDAPARVLVLDPLAGGDGVRAEYELPSEEPEALLGFDYHLGRGTGPQPHLAVATSSLGFLNVRVLAWGGQELREVVRLATPCPAWTCGSLSRCSEGCPDDETCLGSTGRCIRRGPNGEAACGPQGGDEPVGCGCRLEADRATETIIAVTDLDGDDRADLAAATSKSNPVVVWYSSQATSGQPYQETGCTCGQYGRAAFAAAFPRLGGPGRDPPPTPDLVLAGPSGSFVSYARALDAGPVLQCGSAVRFGEIVPVLDFAVGRFSCAPPAGPTCPAYDDLVGLYSSGQQADPTDDPGRLRVAFGGPWDVTSFDDVYDTPNRHLTLRARGNPSNPRLAEVADFNADSHDDVAIFFATPPQVRVWLGKSNRGLGEMQSSVDLDVCPATILPGATCSPLRRLALPDLDGDGRADMVIVCSPSSTAARLRWYSAAR